MSLKIVVLAKQVPDTRNVGPDAMTPEGTVNRSALPARGFECTRAGSQTERSKPRNHCYHRDHGSWPCR